MARSVGLQDLLSAGQRSHRPPHRPEQVDANLGQIPRQTATRMSLPPTTGHIRTTTEGETPTPTLPMDLRPLRQVFLRGKVPRHALRQSAQGIYQYGD